MDAAIQSWSLAFPIAKAFAAATGQRRRVAKCPISGLWLVTTVEAPPVSGVEGAGDGAG